MINFITKNKDMLLYLVFGVLTTLVNIITYSLFTKLLNINYMISNIVAWCLAVIFAYVTNRSYVFNSNKKNNSGIMKEFILFISVRLFSLVIDVTIMYIGVSIMHADDLLVKLFTSVIVVITNYIMSKRLVFRNKL